MPGSPWYSGCMTGAAATALDRASARARREPEFVDVLEALINAPTGGAGEYTQAAARALNRLRGSDALERFKAGALVTADVQHLLGLGTPQAVHRLRSRGKLLGLQHGNATWFPGWQFADGRVRPDLARIIEQLIRFSTDVIAADRVMRLVRDELHGHSIAGALGRPKDAAAAWAILSELGS